MRTVTTLRGRVPFSVLRAEACYFRKCDECEVLPERLSNGGIAMTCVRAKHDHYDDGRAVLFSKAMHDLAYENAIEVPEGCRALPLDGSAGTLNVCNLCEYLGIAIVSGQAYMVLDCVFC